MDVEAIYGLVGLINGAIGSIALTLIPLLLLAAVWTFKPS
jgi:hypothetical protein